MKLIVVKFLIGLYVVFLLTACGVESNASDDPYSDQLQSPETGEIDIPVRNSSSVVCSALNDIMCVDFNDVAPGHLLTNTDIENWFGVDASRDGVINGTINIVADPSGDPNRGNVMRVFRQAGSYINLDTSGGQWRAHTNLMGGADSYGELYFSQDVYIDPSSEWTKEQKFSGLVAGDWDNSVWPDKFSHRPILINSPGGHPDGTIRSYLYDRNYKAKSYSTTGLLTKGQWHTIEVYLKENTVGQSNGQIKIWLNGVLIHSRSDREWRADPNLRLDGLYFNFSFGGDDSTFNVPNDRYDYYDNFVLSTQPITH